ncbi:hypothetical protein DFH11DRAFT_179059 [Phellopilus nigrolimitatus]|nr:hypothetical protein DFH11DRAFT_179059 [Phellopilus nigrolimitatus]
MEQPLTPPPSFHVLRVRARTRTRTISDENHCSRAPVNNKSDVSTIHTDVSTSPLRGRTRSRAVRSSLALNSNVSTRPHLSLTMPPCCSPSPSRANPCSPSCDDELIFQMSPIQPRSPTTNFFDSVKETHSDATRVGESNMHTLSALWENRKRVAEPARALERLRSNSTTTEVSQTVLPTCPLGVSTTAITVRSRASKRCWISPRCSKRRRRQPHLHMRTRSCTAFPSFESSPLTKARQARARRVASKALGHGASKSDCVEPSLGSEDCDMSADTDIDTAYPRRPGPIRARNLRIQSGESLYDGARPGRYALEDEDDADFVSHAFRSSSLDPEKEAMDADDVEEEEYFSSQRSSSLLASFPVHAASTSHSNPSSRPNSRRTSRRLSEKRSEEGSSSKSDADAMLTRGRSSVVRSRRASAEIQEPEQPCAGGDRRGRGRTPAPVHWSSDSMRHAAAAVWVSMR